MNSILVKQLTKLIICNFRTTYVIICDFCFGEALLAAYSQLKNRALANRKPKKPKLNARSKSSIVPTTKRSEKNGAIGQKQPASHRAMAGRRTVLETPSERRP